MKLIKQALICSYCLRVEFVTGDLCNVYGLNLDEEEVEYAFPALTFFPIDIVVSSGEDFDIEIFNNQSSGVLSSSSWSDGFACVPAGALISMGDEIEFYALTTAHGHG
mgnify:CR=1 FL=1